MFSLRHAVPVVIVATAFLVACSNNRGLVPRSLSGPKKPQVGVCQLSDLRAPLGSSRSLQCLTGDDWTPMPNGTPAPGGTEAGCQQRASSCYMIDGDDTNVLKYSSGDNGLYTVDPSACSENTSGSWYSSTDNKPCSTWQIFFFQDKYIGTYNDVSTPPPTTVTKISVGIVPADSNYPSPDGSSSQHQVINGGHLYVECWIGHNVALSFPLQGGQGPVGDRNAGKIVISNWPQNPPRDRHFFFALSSAQAASLCTTLQNKRNTYQGFQDAGNIPIYYAGSQNSNTWAAALLLSSGISQSTLDQMVNALVNSTLGLMYPYAYGAGNQIVQYF